jgi:hypothetical protein
MGLIIIPGQEHQPEPETVHQFDVEELTQLIRETIENNRLVPRSYHIQAKLDRLAEEAFKENDIHLAAALLQISAARASGVMGDILEVIIQTMLDLHPIIMRMQKCRSCGCTNNRPCDGGCGWVAYDLCSRCRELAG